MWINEISNAYNLLHRARSTLVEKNAVEEASKYAVLGPNI